MKHWLKRRTFIFSWIFVLSLLSCGQESSSEKPEQVSNAPFESFQKFPDYAFENIRLTSPTQQGEWLLTQSGFQLKSGSEFNYSRQSDSTEIVLPDHSDLNTLKIYLRSQEYLQKNGQLLEFFEGFAQKTEHSDVFHTFLFEKHGLAFKLSYFVQDTYLRLNFVVNKKP